MKSKILLISIIFIISLKILSFINLNVEVFDLRFYNSKDNGFFSYFEITFLTILFFCLILIPNFFISLIMSVFSNIVLLISLYFLYNFNSFFDLFLITLIISLFIIFLIIYLTYKKIIFLDVSFKKFDLLYFILYFIFLEIILNISMESSLVEIFIGF